ncbi:MAG: response regulator [Thiotrichaceae bacterium]|nr:response regulator [Thiotrichaceae bacterium]PCI11720.1 MAG: hypothetical protein COB71_11250 [Thiotrichales bacterium]
MANLIIADDDPEILSLLELILSPHHTIRTASDGRQVLKLAEAEKPCLLLLDYHMPNMNGSTLAKKCNDLKLPFMFVTAESEWNTVQNIISLGALAYLLKPFNPQTCVTTVDEALGLASERAEHKVTCN